MKIIVSGGGTGGHIYPALTLVSALAKKERTAEFLYVGTQKGLEADIIPKEGIPFETVDIEGLERSFSPANIVRLGRAMHGLAEAAAIVRRFRPDVVIGTGGYVCGPILMAASLAHVPTLIQEQNVVPGVTNKILSKFVTKIAVGTEEALCRFPRKKAVFTGNPIRREVMTASREKALETFGFDAAKRTVLVSGGSRGARSIDRAMVGVLQAAQEYPEVQFLLVTGRGEYEDVMRRLEEAGVDLAAAPHIKVEPYLYNMPEAMAMADLAVFRAGATGLAELTARGVPAILVPYPYAAENHQEYNARALERAGAARVILDRDLTDKTLSALLGELLSEEGKLRRMAEKSRVLGRPEAADEIADLVLEIAKD